MSSLAPFEYLVIGHISHDLTPEGPVAGGTVSFSGRTAQALGCRTAVLTSAGSDFDFASALPGIDVLSVAAEHTTTFENVYTAAGRIQTIYGLAAPLTAQHVPAAWRQTPIVHLAPLANEVDPQIIHLFEERIVGLTPQGWLRRWDENGRVSACEWPAAADILPQATAVILSEEDLPDEATLAQYIQWARLLVLTQGPRGCTVFCEGQSRQIPVTPVTEINPTGAGDIFAAAFLIRLYENGRDPWEAARFANQVAAQSVTQFALADKILACRQQPEMMAWKQES